MESVAHKPCTLRKSNFELLRLLAIIMIIAHHIAYHSNFDFATDSITINRLWIQWIRLGGKIGVNLFVLISGYFLITAPSVKLNKILKLWLQIFTYLAGIYLLFVLFNPQSLGLKTLIKNILPISFSQWWFASAYLVLYLLSPYVNKLLRSLNQKEYLHLLMLLMLIWCIIPTFLNRTWQSNKLLWFIFLYALAGYIRLYVDLSKIRSGRAILIACAIMLLTFCTAVLMDLLGLKIHYFATHAAFFYNIQKLPVLLASLLLFIGFASVNIGYVPWINVLSPACFGIYLIHDNHYIRKLLWNTLFQNAAHQNSNFLIVYTLIQVAVVFAACALLELFRIHVVERAYSKPLAKLSNQLDQKLNRFFALNIFNKL